MTESLLTIRDLNVRYGNHTVLQNINLDLQQSGRLALIGESGSGKSTLALAIAGLLPANASITGKVDFPSLLNRPRLGRDIGMVFQDPNGTLDPMMRIGDQIAEVIVTHQKTTWPAARAQALELLQRVQIDDAHVRLRNFPHEFSGGQKQRIALVAALAGQPQLLIADEPTSALDTVVQKHVMDVLDGLVRIDGLTLLFVTHDIALASQLSDHIAVLYQGRMVEYGTAQQVISAPNHAYTKALLATHIGLDWVRQPHLPEIDFDRLEIGQ